MFLTKIPKEFLSFFSILETVHGMEGQQIGFWTRESTPFFVLVRLLSLDNGGVTAWPNQSRVHVVLLENNKEEKSSYFFRCEKGGMTSQCLFSLWQLPQGASSWTWTRRRRGSGVANGLPAVQIPQAGQNCWPRLEKKKEVGKGFIEETNKIAPKWKWTFLKGHVYVYPINAVHATPHLLMR